MKNSWIWGIIGSGLSIGFAFYFGIGGGHGSIEAALITIAPFSLSSGAYETFVYLPLLACCYWGLLFRLSWGACRPRELFAGIFLLVFHLFGIAVLLQGEGLPRYYGVLLFPHFLLVTSAVIGVILRLRSML